MEKKTTTQWDTRTIVFLALLTAMQIVLTRLLVIDTGFCRISLGSICTILAGLWFGPIGGGACGLVSDLLGCLLKGYAVNPFITIGVMLWGIIPAIVCARITGSKKKKMIAFTISIIVTSVLSTLVATTLGLVLFNGYHLYAILPARLTQWAIMTPIYYLVASALYFSPLTSLVLNAVANGRHSAAHV